MSVRLISYSKPTADSGISDGLQDIVAFCARVSNPANQANTDTNERLIRYQIKN
jgi:thymidylate synthase (FAD)